MREALAATLTSFEQHSGCCWMSSACRPSCCCCFAAGSLAAAAVDAALGTTSWALKSRMWIAVADDDDDEDGCCCMTLHCRSCHSPHRLCCLPPTVVYTRLCSPRCHYNYCCWCCGCSHSCRILSLQQSLRRCSHHRHCCCWLPAA